MAGPYALVPIIVSDAVLTGSTLVEPASGESVWSAAGTYVEGDQRIRTQTHRVYRCVKAIPTARATLPENDPTYWKDVAPTNARAAFDYLSNVQSKSVTSMSFTLKPGFFDSVALYGLVGYSVRVQVTGGGATVYDKTQILQAQALGLFDYLFGPRRALSKTLFQGIPLFPDAVCTVTVTAGTGAPVAVGRLIIGTLRSIIAGAKWGGVSYGASVELQDFSYQKFDPDFGDYVSLKRGNSINVNMSAQMPTDAADDALILVQSLLSVPCAVIGTDVPGYAGLNTFGVITGDMSYDNFSTATFNLRVKGLVQ